MHPGKAYPHALPLLRLSAASGGGGGGQGIGAKTLALVCRDMYAVRPHQPLEWEQIARSHCLDLNWSALESGDLWY